MEAKKKINVEELKKQYEEAKSNFETLGEQLKKAEQEEEARKQAKLASEKEARAKEVDAAYDKYYKLLCAYVKDYGIYSKESKVNNFSDLINSVFHESWWH